MTERQSQQGQYEESLTIPAPPDTIFDFVADVRNLPDYLPTTTNAQPQQGERVRVQGKAAGHPYDADGFLRADRDRYQLEWGADEGYYAGQLQIRPLGNEQSDVTVRLTFTGSPPGADHGEGPSEADIREGMRNALESINNQVTGQGGKQEPRAAG